MPATKPKPATLSSAHKKALADGRRMSAVVDRYLRSINTPKRRGRKVSKAALEGRLADAKTRARASVGVQKVSAAQDVRDLSARLTAIAAASNGHSPAKLEAEFIKVAPQFSAARKIGYGAWRDAGVPAVVLRKAKIARTRG